LENFLDRVIDIGQAAIVDFHSRNKHSKYPIRPTSSTRPTALNFPVPSNCEDPENRPQRFWPIGLRIVAAHIVILLALLIPVVGIHENWLAEGDWNEFKAHWEAKGEIFDLEKLIPPDIPDEQNFAKAPIIAELFVDPNNNRLSQLGCRQIPGFAKIVRYTNPGQRAIGGYGTKLADHLENPKAVANEREAAKAILKLLEPLSPIFDELERASQRPKTRFPVDYENYAWRTMFYYVPIVQDVVRTLHLRARARLALGDPAGATRDILTILRIADHTGSDPYVGSHQMEITFHAIILHDIWEGLESGQLNDSQLQILAQELERVELKSRMAKAIRFERAAWLRVDQEKPYPFQNDQPYSKPDGFFFTFRGFQSIGLGNSFWFRNRLTLSRFLQDQYLTVDGEVVQNWVNPDAASNAKTALGKLNSLSILPVNPYSFLAKRAADGFETVVQRSSEEATRIDLARVAIALELYRREHGGYPATLAPLAPGYIDAVPVDLITGDPLHYRIKPDGTPMIYSVGLNKVDEGGLLKRDRALGDWGWQYTLPDNFDEVDWRD